MKRRVNRLSMVCVVILIVGLALFAFGCAEVATLSDWVSEVTRGNSSVSDSTMGEGWIPSEDGSMRASFSFQLEYVEADEAFSGTLDFTDHLPWEGGRRVALRARIDDVSVDECRVVLYGDYEPRSGSLPRRGGGEFIVTISCGEYLGLYGLLDPTFDISLYGGEFAGYNCGGSIDRGRIDLDPGE